MAEIKNNFWNGRNAFVTGADGFVGSWLAKALADNGANVTVIVRDVKKASNLDVMQIRGKVNIVLGDIIDYKICGRIINEYEIDTCFHLAAQAIVGIANKSPLSTFESNIKGTWNILEACRMSSSVKRIVVASSDKAYGSQKNLPYTEESPLLGSYPYDASKACADILAQSYFKSYGLPISITRNANTYGGGDMNLSRIIPDMIISFLKDRQPVIRSDGTPERDYMYVKDAVHAYLSLAENIERKEVAGEAFNFGSGKPVSVIQLYQKIASLLGKNMKPKILGKATREIDRQYLSIEKAKRALEWQPKYSLDEGLTETIEWYKK